MGQQSSHRKGNSVSSTLQLSCSQALNLVDYSVREDPHKVADISLYSVPNSTVFFSKCSFCKISGRNWVAHKAQFENYWCISAHHCLHLQWDLWIQDGAECCPATWACKNISMLQKTQVSVKEQQGKGDINRESLMPFQIKDEKSTLNFSSSSLKVLFTEAFQYP